MSTLQRITKKEAADAVAMAKKSEILERIKKVEDWTTDTATRFVTMYNTFMAASPVMMIKDLKATAEGEWEKMSQYIQGDFFTGTTRRLAGMRAFQLEFTLVHAERETEYERIKAEFIARGLSIKNDTFSHDEFTAAFQTLTKATRLVDNVNTLLVTLRSASGAKKNLKAKLDFFNEEMEAKLT